MAHVQKPDFIFWRNGLVHLNWRRRQSSRLLAAEACASVVVMLDTPCSDVVWRVLATHCIHQFPLQFPSRASLCAITFQLGSTYGSAPYGLCNHSMDYWKDAATWRWELQGCPKHRQRCQQ